MYVSRLRIPCMISHHHTSLKKSQVELYNNVFEPKIMVLELAKKLGKNSREENPK